MYVKYFQTMRFTVLLLLSLLRQSECLVGYRFQDNRSRNRMVAANGEMSMELRSSVDKMAICISFFVNFNRYSNTVPIFDLRTGYSEKPYLAVLGKFYYKQYFVGIFFNTNKRVFQFTKTSL